MIIDITGTQLTPGWGGTECLENGDFCDAYGEPIECCCDECDYFASCIAVGPLNCLACTDPLCPQRERPITSLLHVL